MYGVKCTVRNLTTIYISNKCITESEKIMLITKLSCATQQQRKISGHHNQRTINWSSKQVKRITINVLWCLLTFLLINSKTVLHILTSKNLTWIKMISAIIVLYLTSHFYQNLLSVVKLRLVDYLSTKNLLNSFQSAYIKHHSTETTLLSIHDHIIKAMSRQSSTIHLSRTSWLICCFWNLWSNYSSWTSKL